MNIIKNIAIVAHDNRKMDIIEWVKHNKKILINHNLICTGTTGNLIKKNVDNNFNINILKSGPLGGDQQIGSMICENKIDILIFLVDPMTIQPHDVDIKALFRLAVLYNIPAAYNRTTADFIITSNLFNSNDYKPIIKDYSKDLNIKN